MIDAPDAYEFSSDDRSERERAFRETLKTLEMAAEFQADYVVLHMGSVRTMSHKQWTGALTKKLANGEQLTDSYADDKLECVKRREKQGPKYFQRAIETLEKLIEPAQEAGVVLAVESRSKYEDVPDEREMIRPVEHFADCPQIGYWHDFGHVGLKHNLGSSIIINGSAKWSLTSLAPTSTMCNGRSVTIVPFTGELLRNTSQALQARDAFHPSSLPPVRRSKFCPQQSCGVRSFRNRGPSGRSLVVSLESEFPSELSPQFKAAVLSATGASQPEIDLSSRNFGVATAGSSVSNAPLKTVIAKLISPGDSRDHPRGWNSNLSHQRKLKPYQAGIGLVSRLGASM